MEASSEFLNLSMGPRKVPNVLCGERIEDNTDLEALLSQVQSKYIKLAFVGEAPGEKEIAFNMPFSGPAGSMFERILKDSGISRSQVYIGNICQVRPPNNKLDPWMKTGHEKHIHVMEGIARVKKELSAFKPNVIVALGGHALYALTGKEGILKWRGSKILSTLVPDTKVVASLHPSMILRNYKMNMVALHDFKRALHESKTRELTYPERKVTIATNYDEAVFRLEKMLEEPSWTFDIETTGLSGWQILCIGFASKKEEALVIPFAGPKELCADQSTHSIFTEPQELCLRQMLRKLLQNDARKCGQGGMYDRYMLAWLWNVMVLNYTDDTMVASKVIYPEFNMGLDFLTSIYTEFPFYKDEGKVWKHPHKATLTLWTQFWNYNGKDCMYTEEVRGQQAIQLEARGLMETYREVMRMQDPLLYMNLRGLARDDRALVQHIAKKELGRDNLQYIVEQCLGRDINVKSHKQMVELLYDRENGMGLPPVTMKGKVSANEDALVKLSQKTSDPLFTLFMGLRKQRTDVQDLNKIRVDKDDRIHYQMNIVTSTGRYNCKAPPTGGGTNMQNISKWMRDVIVADPGRTLGNSDLARAEAKVVAYLCKDPDMIAMFDDPKFDVHRANASRLFQKPEDQITYDERYLAKRVVHASNYGMGPRKMAMIISKDGFPVTERQCKQLQLMYFRAFPVIKQWQREIQNKLMKNRTITTATGRSRFFPGRMDDATFREAYAFEPQEIVCWVISRGIENVWKFLKEDRQKDNSTGLDIHLQVHDSLLWSAPTEKAEECKNILDKLLSVPIDIRGRECLISVDHNIGKDWKACSG